MEASQHSAPATAGPSSSVNTTTAFSVDEENKPAPRDFSHYYSVITNHRFPSPMKQYYRFFSIPGIGNLAGGLPNLRFFPFDTLEAQTAKPERWTPSPNEPPATGAADGHDLVAKTTSLHLRDAPGGGGDSGSGSNQAATHITVPKALAPDTDVLRKIDLATALQYGTAQGYPPLFSFLRQFTRDALHPNVPYRKGVDIVLDVGATDGFSKTLELFVDAWSPDTGDVRDRPGLLCETFVYGNVLSQARPRGVQIVPVRADGGGMVATGGPGSLEDVLANWDYGKGRRPHLLYTVTMGHNPTGILLSLERRKQLYAVCSRFDVLIVEDDPYWYLQFPSAAAEEAKSRHRAPVADAFSASEGYHWSQNDEAEAAASSSSASPDDATTTSSSPSGDLPKKSGYAFLDSLVPSFLQLDTDGRVVRLDTFSKTVAPGCRLGWVTAQPALVERYLRATESSTQQPSGFVQALVAELVVGRQPAEVTRSWLASLRRRRGTRKQKGDDNNDDNATAFTGWQMDGWVRWLEGLRGEYERRMARMCRILDEGSFLVKQGTPRAAADADVCVLTKTPLYTFDWPRGGMFVWLRVLFENHPLYGAASSDGIIDGSALAAALMVHLTRKPHLVLVSPGTMFSATDAIRRSDGWRYLRLCFAAEAEDAVGACSARFARGVRKFWAITTAEELEGLLRGEAGSSSLRGDDDDDDDDDAAGKADDDEEEEEMQMGNLGLYMGC